MFLGHGKDKKGAKNDRGVPRQRQLMLAYALLARDHRRTALANDLVLHLTALVVVENTEEDE